MVRCTFLIYDDTYYGVIEVETPIFNKIMVSDEGIFYSSALVTDTDIDRDYTKVMVNSIISDWVTENFSEKVAVEVLSGKYPDAFKSEAH